MKQIYFVVESKHDRNVYVSLGQHIVRALNLQDQICFATADECFIVKSGHFLKYDMIKVILRILERKISAKIGRSGEYFDGWNFKIIFIRDADDECPKDYNQQMTALLNNVGGRYPTTFVMPKSELETWFLANTREYSQYATIEDIRGTKEKYRDITAERLEFFTLPQQIECLNISHTESSCRSFRKFVKEITS